MQTRWLSEKLTEKQNRLVEEIERRTGVVVDIEENPYTKEYRVQLVSGEKVYDDSGDEIDMPEDLYYIADNPRTKPFTGKELGEYPAVIRRQLNIDPYDKYGTCNKLLTSCSDANLTGILYEMLVYTDLLEMGWHLGRETDFKDPYIVSAPLCMTEEEIMEEIWQTYYCDQSLKSTSIFQNDYEYEINWDPWSDVADPISE